MEHTLERVRVFLILSPRSLPIEKVQTLYPPSVTREQIIDALKCDSRFEFIEEKNELLVGMHEITSDDNVIITAAELWRELIWRFLKPGQDIELCHLASDVERPAAMPRHVKIKDVLRSDCSGRFQVFGSPESLFVRRLQTALEVEDLCEKWRGRIASYLFKNNLKSLSLTEIGSVISRPRQLYKAKGLLEVLQCDTLGRFRLTGDGNYIRVIFDKKAYLASCTSGDKNEYNIDSNESTAHKAARADLPSEDGWTKVPSRPNKVAMLSAAYPPLPGRLGPSANSTSTSTYSLISATNTAKLDDTFAARVKAGKPSSSTSTYHPSSKVTVSTPATPPPGLSLIGELQQGVSPQSEKRSKKANNASIEPSRSRGNELVFPETSVSEISGNLAFTTKNISEEGSGFFQASISSLDEARLSGEGSPIDAYFFNSTSTASPFSLNRATMPPVAAVSSAVTSDHSNSWMGVSGAAIETPSFNLDQINQSVASILDSPSSGRIVVSESSDEVQIDLKIWLPTILLGFPEQLVNSFIEKLTDEGFVLVQDLIIAQQMGQLTLEYLKELGFKLGHFNRLITGLGNLKKH